MARETKDWSPEELQLLTQRYADTSSGELARTLGRSLSSVYSKAHSLGLEKSTAYRSEDFHRRIKGKRSAGRPFTKGNVPWHAGTKGLLGYHPNTARHHFKKGERHGPYMPIGTEQVNAAGYLERKVSDHANRAKKWVAVHRLVWEAANGPVPKGHVVAFLPGRKTTDATRITLDALELVPLAALVWRAHPINSHPELAKLIQLKGAITRQVNRIARAAKEKQP